MNVNFQDWRHNSSENTELSLRFDYLKIQVRLRDGSEPSNNKAGP